MKLEDERLARNDTDYRVLNGKGRPVFRLNIEFHGAHFRKALEMVGLKPEDCFALVTYKIHGALEKQDDEHLAFIFLIVGVPELTGAVVGGTIPDDLAHLSAIAFESKAVTGKRAIEDAIVACLTKRPPSPQYQKMIVGFYYRIRIAPWYVLSARRSLNLLREKLFERAFALRVRGFTKNFRNAELDMHFSLSQDLTPIGEFFRILKDDGLQGLVLRLERGTI